MDENNNARDLEEQAADSRRLWELGSGRGRGDWSGPLAGPCELAQDEFDLLYSQEAGHRWDGWRRLTGDEGYFAACSCGWRSTDTDDLSPMLRQVKAHLDAVRRSRGWGRSPRAPARDESGPGISRGEILALHERARQLRASVNGQRTRLSRSLRHSADLLSASAEQADHLVAELARGEGATAGAAARSAEIMQHKAQRAKELRKAIAAAAAALAVIAEEIAWINQDLETRGPGGPPEYRRMAGEASETAGTAREAGHMFSH